MLYDVFVSKERIAARHNPSTTGSEPPVFSRTDVCSCMKSRVIATAPSMFTQTMRSNSTQNSTDRFRSPQP